MKSPNLSEACRDFHYRDFVHRPGKVQHGFLLGALESERAEFFAISSAPCQFRVVPVWKNVAKFGP